MTERPGSSRMSPETWRRVCLVLDHVHEAPADAREAALEEACRRHGLAVKDVRPFLEAEAQADGLPEELPPDVISSALSESAAGDAAPPRLAAGTRLGPYEILEHAGAGGMGEVYRARDTRLDRIVAIKVLRPHLLASADARERFDGEARAISRLNHPNVCTLHDVGHQDGVDFLVMEYVEGETLAGRIKRAGRLPLDQALRFGSQIAAALDSAHRQGIVHRDLKPANIMITRAGVKLLDFGLALVAASKDGPDDGALAGTPEYMAPEQLARQQADARSDIYACGAVLVEMLTGARARQATAPVVPGAPPALEWTLAKCLAGDPDDRWQSAADLKHHLDWIAAPPAASAAPLRAGRMAAWLAAAATLLALVAIGAWMWTERDAGRAPAAPATFAIDAPDGAAFELTQALSRDGRRVAFTAARDDGTRELWVRALDALAAQRISGTEGAAHPFWSPDGRFVAFFADRKLKKVDLASGAVHAICDAGSGGGGAWNRDDVIVFSPASGVSTGLQRVSASGGAVTPVTTPGEGLRIHGWPQFLSDGRRFIYMRSGQPDAGTYAGRLDSDEAHTLVMPLDPAASKAIVSGGALFYLEQGTLFARRFDESRLSLAGEPVRVAENIQTGSPGIAAFDAAGGVVTYRHVETPRPSQLTWFDRAGRALGPLGEPGAYVTAAISPDGRSVLANRWDEGGRAARGGVAVIDAVTGAVTPLFANAASPVWSPDGARIVFTQFGGDGVPVPVIAAVDGTSPPRPLARFGAQAYPSDWSRDGRVIAGAALRAGTGADVWVADVDAAGAAGAGGADVTVRDLAREPHHQHEPRISPDGRWIAYAGSDAAGGTEVYVRSLVDGAGLRRVSTRGGRSPRWGAGGRILYYVQPDGGLMRVPVGAGASFSPGPPELLFRHQGLAGEPQAVFAGFAYDISPDGTRLLIAVPAPHPAPPPPLIVILNWALPESR